MPISDHRKLTFDTAALSAVFQEQEPMLARLGLPSPPIMISIVPEKATLEVCVFDERKGCIAEAEFGGAALATLLMFFLKHRQVPLPRRSRKFLTYAKDSVTLALEMEIEVPSLPQD